jgi:hypothetical protein
VARLGAPHLGTADQGCIPAVRLASNLQAPAPRHGRRRRGGQLFLRRGIERWEADGKLTASEIASLRSLLASGEVKEPIHHLGVHLVLSVVIAIPKPGLRSLARFVWTFAFWLKAQTRRLRRRSAEGRMTNVHTPIVMTLALIPLFGGAACLASRPLRRKLVVLLFWTRWQSSCPWGSTGACA